MLLSLIEKFHVEIEKWMKKCSDAVMLINDCVWWCGNIHTYIYIGGWKVIGVGSPSEIEGKRVWERAWQLE